MIILYHGSNVRVDSQSPGYIYSLLEDELSGRNFKLC